MSRASDGDDLRLLADSETPRRILTSTRRCNDRMFADLMAFAPSLVDVAWTLGIVAALAYFLHDRIAKLVDVKVQHHYNADLERVKGDLSGDLERLKADLSRSTSEVETLRTNVLSLRAQRQAGVEKRRLEAADDLWAAVKAWQAKKHIVMTMSLLKFEAAAKEAENNPKMREIADALAGGKSIRDIYPATRAHEARPYVTDLAWAHFSAYQAVISYCIMQLTILQYGMKPDSMNDMTHVTALLSATMPDWQMTPEAGGALTLPFALEELEKRILAELRRMIAGEDDDAEHAARAVRINAEVEKLSLAARKEEAQAAFTGDAAQAAPSVGKT